MMTFNRKRLLSGLMLAGSIAAGLLGYSALDTRQRQLIFNPTISRWNHVSELQDVWIPFTSKLTAEPVKLHALWLGERLPLLGSTEPVMLYLHGARWDVWASRARIERLHQLGFSVLAIDYRGFGKTSSGHAQGASPSNILPSESMTYEDAQAAWDWLGQQFPKQNRFIYGHSLGGAVAIDLASKVRDESGVMVEDTFSSVRDVLATTHWGWLPLGPLLTQRFESIDKVAHIGAPLLVVHGSDDDIIKPELGKRLFAAANSPKKFLMVQGGNHHNASSLGFGQYQQALQELFGIQPQPATPEMAQDSASRPSSLAQVSAAVSAMTDTANYASTSRTSAATQRAGHDPKAELRQAAIARTSGPRARSAATDNS